MKKSVLLILFASITVSVFSQNRIYEKIQKARINQVATQVENIFVLDQVNSVSFDESAFKNSTAQTQILLSQQVLNGLLESNPAFLSLTIPITSKSSFELELIPINIFGENFKVINAANEPVNVDLGLYYQGIVNGDQNSVVSFSITKGQVSGIISTDKGNFVLGEIKGSASYILYNDKDLQINSGFTCDIDELDLPIPEVLEIPSVTTSSVSCRAAEIYFEADNKIYTDQGSNLTTATNFVNALFGQVAVLYQNENIDIQLSVLKIWDTADPYISANSTSTMLDQFSTQVGSTFDGDLAHLISGRSLGGGIAYLDVLCNKGTGISAGIRTTVVNVPTYSWNIEVVTHELGHNFGSRHTQSCTWPGGPIDNCVGVEQGPCPPGPTPTNGGTIMSYCHLTPIKINFNNGFGLLPGNLIRLRTQRCLQSSVVATNLSAFDATSTSALLVWDHQAGGTTEFEYKASTSPTWISTTNNSNNFRELSGLTANTAYNMRVKVGCSNFVSANFSTNSLVGNAYCYPAFSTGCNTFAIGIQNFSVDNASWNPNSGCSASGTTILTNSIKSLGLGQSYPFSITPLRLNGNAVQASIWVDLNKNGTFETNERLFNTTSSTGNVISGTFTIPANNAIVSKTRLRLVLNFSSTPTNPCGSYTYGESEDYFINLGGSPCPPSLTLTKPSNNITSGTVKQETSGTLTANNVISGGNVRYDAGRQIQLNPGFVVNNGVVFSAYIDGCGGQ